MFLRVSHAPIQRGLLDFNDPNNRTTHADDGFRSTCLPGGGGRAMRLTTFNRYFCRWVDGTVMPMRLTMVMVHAKPQWWLTMIAMNPNPKCWTIHAAEKKSDHYFSPMGVDVLVTIMRLTIIAMHLNPKVRRPM